MVDSLTRGKLKLCVQLVQRAPSTQISMELLAAESLEVWGGCTQQGQKGAWGCLSRGVQAGFWRTRGWDLHDGAGTDRGALATVAVGQEGGGGASLSVLPVLPAFSLPPLS